MAETVRQAEPQLAPVQDRSVLRGVRTRFGDGATFSVGLLGLFLTWLTIWTAVAIALPALLPGWSSVVITSNSMAPTIQSGDIVIAGPQDTEGIGAGTVIVFEDPGGSGLVTHRVAAVNADGSFQTRGDANDQADSTSVQAAQVIGEGRLLFPFFGQPLLWFQRGEWGMAAFAVATLLSAVYLSRYAYIHPNDS